jgi:predicted MPP superfamily phosphohydrolase
MVKSISRRSFLTMAALAAPNAAYARLVEPGWLELTQRECCIPDLARPVNLVHLSDFHASHDVPQQLIERAIEMALQTRPDVICVTGDFVTDATGFDAKWYAKTLRRLAAAAPSFASLGNHDGGVWSATRGGFRTTAEISSIVEGSGISLLANRSARIALRGAELQLVGVGDLWAEDLDAAKAFGGADPHCPTVLLSHNPDTKELLGEYHWTLMLSGHTHGGQVVAPVIGWSPAPVRDREYVSGLKPWKDRWIQVSRGVGNIAGVRYNCRPEVTRIRLLPL